MKMVLLLLATLAALFLVSLDNGDSDTDQQMLSDHAEILSDHDGLKADIEEIKRDVENVNSSVKLHSPPTTKGN